MVRQMLEHVTPDEHQTFFTAQYFPEPPPIEIVERIEDHSIGLTDYHRTEAMAELQNMTIFPHSHISVKMHPKIEDACGTLRNVATYELSRKQIEKTLRTIPHELRLLMAHILSIQYIQSDQDFCKLYTRETGNHIECSYSDEDEETHEPDDEERVTIGAWDEEDDEDDISLQSQFEYLVLREAFERLVQNTKP